MGQQLRRALGDDYFTLVDTALEPPEPGSVEAAFADAGLGLGIADLRTARTETPDRPDASTVTTDLHT
ncbi:hypothetical protein [Streptomyces niveus]|uniref:hypothetical protein n=1 Tax=Streptomyces niveus TaxID=193462 RepID=UPI0036640561